MPYTELTSTQDDTWQRLLRRALIFGPPNAGKSYSSRTFHRPIAIVSAPNELGVASLPIGEEGVKTWMWDLDFSKPVDWIDTVEATRRLMADLVTGKLGKFRTVFYDGLHKLEFCYLNAETGGAVAKGDMSSFDGRKMYPAVKNKLLMDVRRWLQSPIEYLVFTAWIGRDKEDSTAEKSPTHIFPALTGQTAQDIVGEFSLCLYAERQGYGPAARYLWQPQADPKVWGAGLKLPSELAKKIPPTIPQDWAVLEKYLTVPSA